MSRLTIRSVSSKSSIEKSGQFQNWESGQGPEIGNVKRNKALKRLTLLAFVIVKKIENTLKHK